MAIKVLPPNLTRNDTAKQRFLQEAQAASALDHPNICTIHEINETDDGQLYLVMLYYEGETLKDRIERGALAVDDAVDIATQVGRGLAETHGAGIVHRDIKPANLPTDRRGRRGQDRRLRAGEAYGCPCLIRFPRLSGMFSSSVRYTSSGKRLWPMPAE